MSVERRVYDREFKIRAVKLYEEGDKRLRDVEDELGIGNGCLSHWKKEFAEEKDDAFPGQGQLPDKDREIARLQRENEVLREERDILKKAVGIFSKKPQ
jgi:transposase